MNRARERDESTSSSGNVSVASVGGGRKRNKNQANKPPNPVTVEKVRMIMEQEGRSARNLVSWSIPLDTYLSKAKPSKTSRHRNQSKRAQSCESALRKINAEPKEKYVERSYSGDRKKQKNLPNESLMGQASGGPRKNVSIRARYWAYLFENLRRAVDEIYTTCEGDASVMECKEVLLVLDNYRHDFQALINWIKLQERLDNAGIHDRPTSLAWEVRKSSPGRPRQKVTAKVPEASAGRMSSLTSDTKINRLLNFSKAADVASLNASSAVCLPSTVEPIKGTTHVIGNLTMQHATVTWADRVKGIAPVQIEVKREVVATENLDVSETYPKQNPADDDGGEWETVSSRTRQSKHSKNIKHEAQVLKNIANTAMQHHTKPIRLTPEKPAPKPDTGFLNLVVDHLIESGSPKLTREQLKTEVDKCLEVTPVQFMNDCDAKESDKFQHDATEKLTFAGDFLQGQGDGLCDLDDAEAQFFKTVQDENAKVPEQDKTLEELPTLENSSKPIIKPDLVTMEQLKQHDESIAAAEEQERDLRRQIQEVEEGKPGGRDTPEIETDSESARSSMGAKDIGQLDKTTNGPLEWSEFLARYDYTEMGHNSWCELVEEEELREPGRAVQMHEKLSSPSRKRTPAESKRKLEEKHRKAEARRLQMQEEKTHRIHELTEKVQEVVSWKNDLIQRQKLLLQSYHDEKLARAEEMRAMQLLNIKKKAQAEDTKVNEIAFINELQEQNKRHEVLMRIGEHEARMQEIEMERSKQMEMKNAKEEIFKERRRALEKERQERIEELKVKRKEQDARIEQQKIEKEKEREKIAKERARDRELRLSARNAAQQEAVTELQKKIQLKHDESERRHQEQLEHRKEKAVELSLGRFSTNPAPGVAMTPCPGAASIPVPSRLSTGTSEGDGVNVSLIGEETVAVQYDRVSQISIQGKGDAIEPSSASRGSTNTSPRSHIDECKALKEEAERLKERQKTMRKRAKKLRIRMAARGKEFLKRVELKAPTLNGTNKTKVVRLIKDANRQLTNQKECSGPWPANRVTAFDRTLGEIVRCLEKEAATDQSAFRIGGGFEMLERIFEIYFRGDSNPDLPAILPDRLLGNAASCFRFACAGNHDNCVYAVYSNRVMGLVDALLPQISKNEVGEATKSNTPRAAPASQSKKTTSSLPKVDNMFDPASPSLLRALAVTLSMMAGNPPTEESVKPKSKSFTQMIPAPNNEHRKVLEVYLNRGLDVISYIVASRVLDVLGQYLSNVRHEVAPGSNLAAFVESGLKFLESATSFVTMRNRLSADNHQHASKHKSATNNNKTTSCEGDSAVNQWDNDPTQLLPTLQHTELMGIVSVLYGLLLHGAPERPTTLRSAAEDEQRASIQPQTLNVALAVMKVLNAVAEMDLRLLQASLGAEGVSLEYRHICTYLLWYCVQGEHTELLHEVIVSVGHFTLDNRNNQNIVDSGAQPTVLQQLCLLPFAYFSSAKPMWILLPTLIACCHDNPSNLTIMEQEASASLLINFIQTILEESTEKQKTKKSDKKRNGILADLDRGTSLVDHPLFTTDYLNKSWTFFTDKQS